MTSTTANEIEIDVVGKGKPPEQNNRTLPRSANNTIVIVLAIALLLVAGVAVAALVMTVSLNSQMETQATRLAQIEPSLVLAVSLNSQMETQATRLAQIEQPKVLVSTSATAPSGYGATSSLMTGVGEWAPGVHMPEERSDLQAVYCGGVIVLLGGLTHANTVANTTWSFDPVAETYSTAHAAMPTARFRFGAACVDGKVYAAGGFATKSDGDAGRCLNTVDVYDVATNTWSAGPPLAIKRGDLALVASGGKLYALGGYGYEYPYPDPAMSANEVFDPSSKGLTGWASGWTPSWSTVASMPDGGKGDIAAVEINGKLYVPGGWNNVFLDSMLEYDPATDAWQTLPSMRAPRGDKAVAALAGRAFVIGGETWSGKSAPCSWDPSTMCNINQVPVHGVEAFTPASKTWTAMAPLPEARFRFGAASANGAIFTFGGHAHGEVAVNTAWTFHFVPQAEVYFHHAVA